MSLLNLLARGVPELGFSLGYSEGVEDASLWAKRETLMERSSPACLLLALPGILQPHSSRHLPGPENHLDFFKDVWQSSTQTQKSGLNGNVSLFDAEDFTKVLLFFSGYYREGQLHSLEDTGWISCLFIRTWWNGRTSCKGQCGFWAPELHSFLKRLLVPSHLKRCFVKP